MLVIGYQRVKNNPKISKLTRRDVFQLNLSEITRIKNLKQLLKTYFKIT